MFCPRGSGRKPSIFHDFCPGTLMQPPRRRLDFATAGCQQPSRKQNELPASSVLQISPQHPIARRNKEHGVFQSNAFRGRNHTRQGARYKTVLSNRANHGAHHTTGSDLAHQSIVAISHIQVVLTIDLDIHGEPEFSLRRRPIVVAKNAGLAGDGADQARWSNFADHMIGGIRHIQITCRVQRATANGRKPSGIPHAIHQALNARPASQQTHGLVRIDLVNCSIRPCRHKNRQACGRYC